MFVIPVWGGNPIIAVPVHARTLLRTENRSAQKWQIRHKYGIVNSPGAGLMNCLQLAATGRRGRTVSDDGPWSPDGHDWIYNWISIHLKQLVSMCFVLPLIDHTVIKHIYFVPRCGCVCAILTHTQFQVYDTHLYPVEILLWIPIDKKRIFHA